MVVEDQVILIANFDVVKDSRVSSASNHVVDDMFGCSNRRLMVPDTYCEMVLPRGRSPGQWIGKYYNAIHADCKLSEYVYSGLVTIALGTMIACLLLSFMDLNSLVCDK